MKEDIKQIVSKGFQMMAEEIGLVELTYRRTMAVDREEFEKEKDKPVDICGTCGKAVPIGTLRFHNMIHMCQSCYETRENP